MALLLAMVLVSPATLAAVDPPTPPRGERAATVLALLDHQRQSCDLLAGQVLQQWRELGGKESAQEAVMRDRLLERHLSDLAAARAIADLVDRFLPGARAEQPSETAASLDRLTTLVSGFCDLVALPTAPRSAFEAQVGDSLARIDRERVELGRLLVISDESLSSTLEPYLVSIELAGIEAEGEYLDYLDSIRPEPVGPSMADLMNAWHQQMYSPAVAPTKKLLGVYLDARQRQDTRQIGKTCRQMATELSQLLQRDEVFDTPDVKLEEPLRRAFVELRSLATDCTAGKSREIEKHWADAQLYLSVANERMSVWALRP